MNKHRLTPAAVLFGVLALGFAGTALARHDHDDDYYRGQGWGHHKHHHEREVIYYERPVMVRPAVPVMVPAPVYYEPAYYYPPRRSPSVVIGVDIPPLVIPLR